MNTTKKPSWLKRAVAAVLAVFMAVTLLPLSSFRLTTAQAAAGDVPAHNKNIVDNGNGTYKLSLDVKGDADTEKPTAKANILIVYDVSGSMEYDTYRYTETTGSTGEQYGYFNGGYNRIYYRNGAWRTSNSNYGTVYNGTRYTRATVSRGDAAEKVAYDFANALFAYNKTADADNVEMALVAFSSERRNGNYSSGGYTGYAGNGTTAAWEVEGWTTDKTAYLNNFSSTGNNNSAKMLYGGGTNWEAAMQRTLNVLAKADADPTYVVFITDGLPTFYVTGGNGTSTTSAEYRAPEQEVVQIENYNTATHSVNANDNNTTLYGIFAFGGNEDRLDDLIYYAQNGSRRETYGTTATPNYYNATDQAALAQAISDIFATIAETLGITNTSITDGTTNNVSTNQGVVELLEVDTSSYEYWLSLPVSGSGPYTTTRKDLVSGEDYTITFTAAENGSFTASWVDSAGSHEVTGIQGSVNLGQFKYKWTESNDLYKFNPPAATFTDGAVKWDLSPVGTLLDGVTYTVTFDVYPSQTTYDYIAGLKNGTIKYSDLPAEVRQYLVKNPLTAADTAASYDLITNTTTELAYEDTRTDDGPQSTTFNKLDPVGTTAEQMTIVKTWDNSIDDIQKEALDMNINQDGSYYGKVALNDANNYTNSYFIATGLLTTETVNGTVTVKTLDPGHDYVMTEPVGLAYNWDLIAETVHPMLIDGTLYSLIKVDKPSAMTGDFYDNGTPDNHVDDYYHIVYTANGTTKDYGYYQISGTGATVSAYNQRRNSLILNKVVEDNGFDVPEDTTFEFKMNVDNKVGTGDDADVWFSIHSSENYVQTNMVYDFEHTKVIGAEPETLVIDTTQTATAAATSIVSVDGDHLTYTYGGQEYTVKIASGPAEDGSYEYYVYEIIGQEGDKVTYTRYGVEYTAPYAGMDGEFYTYYTGFYHGPNASDITVNLKPGEFLRFVNLPIGTEYSFTESTPPGEFSYDSAKAEIKTGAASSYSEDSNATVDDDARKVSGTLPNGNSFYKSTFTNTMDKVDVTATKVWEDNDNQDGLRKAVTLHLNKSVDGGTATVVAGQDKTIPAGATGDALTVTWEDLPTIEGGKSVEYSVTEDAIDGYTTAITKDENGANAYIVTNTHEPEVTQVTVKKVWDDSNDIGKIRPASITAQLKADGVNYGDPVTMNESGEWTYTWENLPKYKAGEVGQEIVYTADETAVPSGYTKTGPVETTDDDGYAVFTVTNTYNPTPVSVNPPVQKIIENNPDLYNKGNFTFTIEATDPTDAPMPAKTSITNVAANEVAGKTGYYAFGDITFTMPGTYKYTIKESGGVDGVTNDRAGADGKTLTFTVTDDGTGKLVVDPTTDQVQMSFTNTYNASGKATITATKAIKGAEWPEGKTLTFTLTGTGNAPMPETTTASLSSVGTVSFGPIDYKLSDAGKEFTYTISEDGFGAGWTGSGDITATVKVTDNGDGSLKTEVTYDPTDATITNTYKAEGEATIEATKALEGAGWPVGKTLTFTLAGTDSAPMPQVAYKTLTEEGSVSFGPIAYTEADAGKTYTYTISEDGFGKGWTGSGDITATVEVTDNGNGTLATKVTYNPADKTITNTYKAEGKATLEVTKAIKGAAWPAGKTLTFTLDGKGGTLPETKTVTLREAGKATFGDITYTEADAGKTYTYTITEDGFGTGWKGAPEQITATVVVTDNGDGTLKTEVTYSPEDATITNTYKAEGEAVLEVTKALKGAEWPVDEEGNPKTLTLTLAGEGGKLPETKTVELTEAGKATFDAITYTEADAGKTYTYTISEDGFGDGWTGSGDVKATVVVTDNGDGTLKTEVTYDKDATITNTYVAEGTAVLEATKAIKGAEWPEGKTITFTLDGKGGTLPETKTVTLEKAGKATFGAITYTEADAGKTYTYTIGEDGFGKGWTGSGEITATVEVIDKGDGTLETKVTYSPEDATITNTYKATGEAVLEVTKELAGAAWPTGKTLTFTLAGEGGKLPETKTVTLTEAGEATFGAITYDESDAGKTYTYTITEDGFGTGWTGSGAITATVVVTDNGDGTLKTDVTYDKNAKVINTYEASGKVVLDAKKVLTGRDWMEGETFTFTLLGADGQTIEDKTVTKDNADAVEFSEIKYTEADAGKTYTYTISETSELPANVTKSDDITATVVVSDNGDGTLKTEVTYSPENKTITNTYVPTPVKAKIAVNKTIEPYVPGSDKKFEFTLTPVEGAPMPEGKDTLSAEITTKNGKGGTVFDEIEYKEAGTYQYTVVEKAETAAGWKYDTNTYTVTVTVTDDPVTGKLSATIAYPEEDQTAVEVVNEFREEGTEVVLTVNKEIEDLSNSAEDATFTFELRDADGKVLQTKEITTKDFKGSVDFDKIEYTESGTYNYTIVETGEAPSGWTYDTKEYPVVIVVSDNFETAVLESETKIDGETTTSLTITNTYKAAETKATIKVTKDINDTSGSAPKDTVFTFTLAKSGDAPMPDSGKNTTTVTGKGEGSFDEITYDKAGTYNYTINEEAGDGKGWIYDTASYPVTVTVTDENGALKAVAAYGDNSETSLTITNTYDPEDAKAAPKARKVIEDKSGSAPSETFTFNLLDKDGKVVEIKTRENGGYVEFSDLTFAKVGTYEYTIQEVAGSTPGFKYDTAPRKLTIEVTDAGDGKLVAEIKYADANEDGEVVITNVYEPDPVPVETSAYLKKVVDQMRPNVESETFNFTLEEKAAEGEEAAKPLTATVTATKADEYAIDFGTLTFDKVGTYTYTLTEVLDNLDGGWIVDGSPVEVTITVSDGKDGKLKAEVSEYKITNTFETVKVEGEKIWDDKEIADWEGYEHPEIKIVLNADGKEIDSVTLNEESGWKYEFKDLPKYKTEDGERGVEIEYTVTETNKDGKEIAAEGYTVVVSEDNSTVTNTPVIKEKDNPLELTIKKVDDNTKEAITGAEFTLTDADGKETVYKIGEDGTVNVEFTKAGEYTLAETKAPEGYVDTELPSYKVVVEREQVKVTLETEDDLTFWQKLFNLIFGDGTDFDKDTVTLTVPNTPIPTEVTVNKTWLDMEDSQGKRPATISVTVTGTAEGDSEPFYTDTQDIKVGSDETTYTWTELPTYRNGKKVTYEVTEAKVEGYDEPVVADLVKDDEGNYSVEIKNIVLIDIPVEKTWVDFNNKYELRPESIELTLNSDQSEEAVATGTLTEDGDWKYTFEKLPAYTEDGTKITYSVEEAEVEHYDGEVKVTETETGFEVAVTNTLKTGDLKITKDLTKYNQFVNGNGDAQAQNVTFVFLITATFDGREIYKDYAALTFDGTGSSTIELKGKLPVGAKVTVEEVDSGAGYVPVGEDKVSNIEIKEGTEDVATANFNNAYNDEITSGYGVVNKYSNDGSGWEADNSGDNRAPEGGQN